MGFTVVDDGTLDTVLMCQECGQEVRYTYAEPPEAWYEWEDWCLDDAKETHECLNA